LGSVCIDNLTAFKIGLDKFDYVDFKSYCVTSAGVIGHCCHFSGSELTPNVPKGGVSSDDDQWLNVYWHVVVSEEPYPFTTYQNTYHNYPPATYLGTSQKSGNNNLWIETSQGRTQYAAVLQYSSVYLIASTPTGGQGKVYELYPSTTEQGVYSTKTYSFNPGDNRLEFAADVPGKHILLFSINNRMSNGVGIDVKGSINSLDQQDNADILGKALVPPTMA